MNRQSISNQTSRRDFIKAGALIGTAMFVPSALNNVVAQIAVADRQNSELSKVFMTKEITSAAMLAMYAALKRNLTGKVAVKVSTGEPGGHHFLSPSLIKDLVQSVNGTIVECNTAYGGSRSDTARHKQVAADHGFTAIASVDIMDEDGSISIPFPNGKNITEDFVGSHFANYDSFLVLSHFKGHAMAGFGGALKNISIGIGSAEGKCWIHSGGNSRTSPWGGEQNAFLESMAEAGGAVMNRLGENILFINVMNHLSIDCDCDSNPAPPELDDIGILASLDPVALDKACIDQIYAADTQRSASLRRRIEGQNGTLTLTHAEALGLGSRQYELVMLDDNVSGIESTPDADNLYHVHLSPANDYLNVSGDFEQLILINMNGSIVARTEENTMNISTLSQGIYLLQINSAKNGIVTRKIRKR